MSLGKRIHRFRKFRGISQKELAKRIGVSTMALSRYERDVNKIAPGDLEKIAVELDIEVSYLIMSREV